MGRSIHRKDGLWQAHCHQKGSCRANCFVAEYPHECSQLAPTIERRRPASPSAPPNLSLHTEKKTTDCKVLEPGFYLPCNLIIEDTEKRAFPFFQRRASHLRHNRLVTHGICEIHLPDHRTGEGIPVPCSEPHCQFQPKLFGLWQRKKRKTKEKNKRRTVVRRALTFGAFCCCCLTTSARRSILSIASSRFVTTWSSQYGGRNLATKTNRGAFYIPRL